MLDQAMAAFRAAVREFHGDPKRFYLTGLSMGGYGAYALAARYPGLFAAVTPVSGGVQAIPSLAIDAAFTAPAGRDVYAALASALGETPVWSFHGAQDPIVPVEDDRKLAAALKAAHPGDRYTEYPSAGHDAWDQAYADEDWARWLFSQRLP
jgi:predicted peptidase